MGQKIHPTGFRIGMNKQYTSTWFANIKNYKKVLLEDYNVRKLFEKEWVSLIKSLGVFSLEIKRTVNQNFNISIINIQ